MKILALVTDAFGGYGGIAQYNRDYLRALADMTSVEEIIVLPRIAPGFEAAPARIRQLKPVRDRAAYALAAVHAALRRKPDIIFNGHLYHGPLALMLARLTGARLVSQLHGTEIWAPARKAHLDALLSSALVNCVSRDTRARYLNQLPADVDNAIVIPNTVGDAFCLGDRSAARARFGLTHEFALLTVARLDCRDGYKGHELVLWALPEILSTRNDVIYMIAGIGDDRERLEALAASLGVGHAVRFLGKVPGEDLPDLYRAADLFALPSTGEGFGIVFLEAMACGTPAIGLNVGGAPDALGEGELGLCVEAKDFPYALKAAVAQLPSRPTDLPARVRQRFGREAFDEAVCASIERVGAQRAPPSPALAA